MIRNFTPGSANDVKVLASAEFDRSMVDNLYKMLENEATITVQIADFGVWVLTSSGKNIFIGSMTRHDERH